MKRLAIISTGSEIVDGRVTDANAAYLSSRLRTIGLKTVMHMAVGDVRDDIEHALMIVSRAADVVVMSGGLGPTDDDHTLEVLSGVFGTGISVHEPSRLKMDAFFRALGRTALAADMKMVSTPEGAEVFVNNAGLAPGYALEMNGITYIVLPGVPAELHWLSENRVVPYLAKKFGLGEIESLEVKTVLVREAEVNELVGKLDVDFGSFDWGITTSHGTNSIFFWKREGRSFPREKLIAGLRGIFGDRMLPPGSRGLEYETVRILGEKGRTIAVAESCTGGLIQKRLTDVPGASAVFAGGVVTYSNESKMLLLDVPPDILASCGAVSEETAGAMAHGAMKSFGASMAVSTTGIAGPDGGTPGKPVGTVCFAIADGKGVSVFRRFYPGDRERIRFMASQYALDLVRMYCMGI